ncbi:hypothetical protein L202_02290 [Cryptococcus amylolentus CBS 6039]|uniref:Uncharacterized protein n=1 Tax=Cryptococcus amylolentus CBS 6039 TaxID=1295533 RepID=A0A1E3I007_9TREE|nr:hypothetical protein L202_02290 [Cryptococcus amylolentus CBS 6039]ODN81954.1 hypothetical protein L202_02290 [Cryptococcus amylolentus CBS 6039]
MPTDTANKSKGKRRSTSQNGNSTEYHLVQWLIMRSGRSMKSNFERLKTLPKGGNGGRANLHKGAIQYLVEKGCSSERQPDTVKAKILSLRKSYTEALQFKSSTGAGQLDGEEQNSGVLKRCQRANSEGHSYGYLDGRTAKNGEEWRRTAEG